MITILVFLLDQIKQGHFFWPPGILVTELQKASNLPPGKIFKVCRSSSQYCEVGLCKLKIKMNLENESLFFFQKEGMISGIDHHLLIFGYVSV